MQRLSHNQRMLLDLLRRHQPIARADVTELTDLTQQSVHRLIEGLISDGFVQTERAKPNGRGKPSPLLTLAGSAVYSLGVSVDAEQIVFALIDLNCSVIARRRVNYTEVGLDTFIDMITAAFEQMAKGANIPLQSLCGIGLALSSQIVGRDQRVTFPSSLETRSQAEILNQMEAKFGVPIFQRGDAMASAICESLIGVGQAYKNFALLAFDQHLCVGLILNGQPYSGQPGNAGDLSLLVSDGLQSDQSMRNIMHRLQASGVSINSLDDLWEDFDVSWPGVDKWLQEVVPQVNHVTQILNAVLAPDAIILGGKLPPVLGQMIMERIKAPDTYPDAVSSPALCLSRVGCDTAAIGAALLPLKSNFFL